MKKFNFSYRTLGGKGVLYQRLLFRHSPEFGGGGGGGTSKNSGDEAFVDVHSLNAFLIERAAKDGGDDPRLAFAPGMTLEQIRKQREDAEAHFGIVKGAE